MEPSSSLVRTDLGAVWPCGRSMSATVRVCDGPCLRTVRVCDGPCLRRSVSADVGAFGEIAPPRRFPGEAEFVVGIQDVAQ